MKYVAPEQQQSLGWKSNVTVITNATTMTRIVIDVENQARYTHTHTLVVDLVNRIRLKINDDPPKNHEGYDPHKVMLE